MPSLTNAVVLVTGANGGIGTQFVHSALARGAAKVYASARIPRTWDDSRIVPLTLDVTDAASIDAAAAVAADVTVVVNNAGGLPPTASLLDIDEQAVRQNMEINFFAPLFVARAFAPILAEAENAALIDIHSVASWYAGAGVYSASKAAIWSATNSLRLELAPRGIHVTGVHMGYVDTAMAAHTDDAKMRPADLVTAVLDGVERDEYEIVADELSRQVKAGLAAPIEALYPELRAQ
ncbi:SDR family oxidoreductase [Rathayibacter tanaceti]|uniref:Short-subunit dehydrogenase n=2 Tax=Rathayibacter tanaceti TaxID=1671680 RepID=A0ACD2XJT6_9MICO|nr:SDR family oxidoreductase [Rathayibacter tanaceti]KZX22560.1 putative oxidoreductase [Rathayibacter tanaceti]QHC54763.1 SDR family NAD(P)-dependent oxidoreductase [Rathayibacter tanaceti]TCO37417.1 short-subunit dehydrogenase [Rathayibacter tanaceti]